MDRFHAWTNERPWIVDIVMFATIGMFVWLFGMTFVGYNHISTFAFGLAFSLPLLIRRTDPDIAALAIVPAHVWQLIVTDQPMPGNFLVPIMIYAAAAYGRERFTKAWLLFGIGAGLIGALRWTVFSNRPYYANVSLIEVGAFWVACSAVVASAWLLGLMTRARVQQIKVLEETAQALERERDQALELAAADERQRIARDMHDVIAHSLSVIVVQADGGAYAASAGGDPTQRLATAERALTTIQSTARSALTETRRLVGILARGEGQADRAPQAGLVDIESLISGVRDAGRDARLTVTGDVDDHPPLGPSGELAAYRVVQEGLTNVMKHAGPDTAVTVDLSHTPSGLTVTVRDNGPGSTGGDGRGHGLVGMRERVAAVGGSMRAGNRFTGGFEVLTLVGRGLTNTEIAGSLFLGEATVKTHIGHILAKLALRDRVQMVITAYDAGLVRPRP